MDLVPSSELITISGYIRKIKPDSQILMASAETGLGFDELSRMVLNGSSKILIPPNTRDYYETSRSSFGDELGYGTV
ncbi:MAG: hypothetical protein ACUVWK_04665 [Nitrososphaerales archaeon]